MKQKQPSGPFYQAGGAGPGPRGGPGGAGPGGAAGGAGKNFPRGAPRETPIFPNFPFLRGENYPPRVLVGIPPIL